MVALPQMPARTRLPSSVATVRPLAHAEAAALVVPHPVLVPSGTGWEPAWLLACGAERGDERRYLVQRDGAASSEPEWLDQGPVALPGDRAPEHRP